MIVKVWGHEYSDAQSFYKYVISNETNAGQLNEIFDNFASESPVFELDSKYGTFQFIATEIGLDSDCAAKFQSLIYLAQLDMVLRFEQIPQAHGR